MSIEYTAYSPKPEEEVRSIVAEFKSRHAELKIPNLIRFGRVSDRDQKILREDGHGGRYTSFVWFLLDKSLVVEETNALKVLRDEYLGRDDSLFLLNGDTILAD